MCLRGWLLGRPEVSVLDYELIREVYSRLTEGIARLENIVLNVKCGGGVIDNRKHLRRFAANIWA